MSCCDPCNTSVTNTAACESLPSQITNFTLQFFGEVVKTEVDGQVIWSLPCNLDIGLPNNQRAPGEGLACYFLRLFDEGIVGLTGPAGATGPNGTDGRNAYTVTLASFVQGTPNVVLLTAYNPAIMEGAYIFVGTSGWYQVTATDTSGTVYATLIQALPGAPAVITAGKLVVLSGVPGANGLNGTDGTNGTNGTNGVDVSSTNGVYFAPVGVDYNLQVAYAAVDFTNSSPNVLLPQAGQYRMTVVADLVGLAGAVATEKAFLKLHNVTTATDVPGSEHAVSNMVDTIRSQIVITALVTTLADSQQVAVYGKADVADNIAVVALNTTVTFERLA